MSEISPPTPWSHPLRFADLPTKKPTRFDLIVAKDVLARIAADLDLLGLKKLRFAGTLRPVGKRDWELDATVGATVVQSCVVSLVPVTTRIDEPVRRIFLADLPEFEAGSEVEMEIDDATDPLGEALDLVAVMIEALTLNLPLYPKSTDADLPEMVFTEPGKAPMTNEEARPFSGLKSLRDRLENKGD